jgi:hypothetical protein
MPDLPGAEDALGDIDRVFGGLRALGLLVESAGDLGVVQQGLADIILALHETGARRIAFAQACLRIS